ncbi:hypothetical protein NDN17_19510 [Shewanella algae]|uniref:hypothetical protein n=1 Tax=Shewanella algae TaxID=38313 RepID=UPI002034E346|nr:hypothetical protein [Shewanella algae]MCM2530683.1 hypothetical protein [Shewanella algae]
MYEMNYQESDSEMTDTATAQKDMTAKQLQRLVIRQLGVEGTPVAKLARMFDLAPSTVSRICGRAQAQKVREQFDLKPEDNISIANVKTDKAVAHAKMLWRTTRKSKRQIASEVGVCQRVLAENGAFAETTFD